MAQPNTLASDISSAHQPVYENVSSASSSSDSDNGNGSDSDNGNGSDSDNGSGSGSDSGSGNDNGSGSDSGSDNGSDTETVEEENEDHDNGNFINNKFTIRKIKNIANNLTGEFLQQGEGARPHFIVENEYTRYFPRMRVEGVEIQGRLPQPPPNSNIYDWLERCVRDLHQRLCGRGGPGDRIGLTINSEKFNHGPLWLSFRPIQDFKAVDLWDLLFSAMQSANEFNVSDRLSVTCHIASVPTGSGRVKMTEEDVSKKSILKIRNDDNLCLPRSLAVCYAYVVRGQIRTGQLHRYWSCVRQTNGTVQKKAAEELLNLANVEIPSCGCGIEEIHKFQIFFATRATAIVVYSFSGFARGHQPIYDGTRFVSDINGSVCHRLNIMFYERSKHYQPILNLIGASGSNGYCIPCNKRYSRAEEHRCSNKCYKCMAVPPCDMSEELKKCTLCFRSFFGNVCYENHTKTGSFNKTCSVCDKIKVCQICFKTMHTKNRRDKIHQCSVSFCNTCKAYMHDDHMCYVQTIKPVATVPKVSAVLFLFYDFETQQSTAMLGDDEKKIHIPNLCVVQQVCTYCLDNDDISIRCDHCGVREYLFQDDPVKQFVELALAPRKNFRKVICIAHNAQGFDGQFIFKYINEKYYNQRVKPEVILNGSKIILMTVMNVKFIDSLNYFHMALSNLPKSYGLPEIEKGVFPHMFNTPENQSYEGPLPPLELYSPDTMNSKERERFLEWYNEQLTSGYVFNFKNEIIRYCKQDVKILRLACLAFRKTFMKFEVDPFDECSTIASACMRVFRKKFLKKNQIGIIPTRGYRRSDNQSEIAIHWLCWMERNILGRTVQHAGQMREKKLPEGFVVDGYCKPQDGENHKGIVLQFHGCFWHGCSRCYRINRDLTLTCGETMDDRYERTLGIGNKIRASNYKLIEKWECEFKNELSQNEQLQRFVRENTDYAKRKPLNPRDAFFGGRTGNTVKVFDCQEQEKIKYVDVCSLYPYICKYGKYPVGHPTIYVGQEQCSLLIGSDYDISKVNGLIMCDILPPRNLYHPLLPARMHGKLIFALCRTCCEEKIQDDCPHENPNDRILHGTWVSEEVKAAVGLGYVVKRVYEIWQYRMTQYNQQERRGGVFAEYIDEFFTQKTMASGYPPDCTTEEAREQYVREIENSEGIRLDKASIIYNPGLRSVAKLCLNSLWGKFGQRENMTQTEVISKPERLTELLTSAELEVNGILPVNDDILYASWCYKSEALVPSPMTSVVIAAFTTAQARLKLFEYLHVLGPRALYYDTDSVFYVSNDDENGSYDLPIGTTLGSLTDELADKGVGAYISSFLSGGPKFYAYKCVKPNGDEDYVCKVKGIRLNYTNSQHINFDTIRKMITTPQSEIVLANTAIRRTAFHDVITQLETKTCKPVYGKRRFVDLNKSYPYGYRRGSTTTDAIPQNCMPS